MTTKRRVLVVDDEPDQVQMLAMLLRDSGHRVECATTALYALALARNFRPEFAAFPEARLFAITGRDGDEARRRSLDAGFEDHLVKPLDVAH